MKILSQLDYPHINFPGTPHSWGTYGCLATCLCMLLDKTVEQFVAENPNGWTADGNLKTDAVLAKYGYKIVREPLTEGQNLPLKSIPVIFRTSFFNPRFPTHFFVQLPNSTDIVDPASRHNPKQENRYKARVNEMRYLVPINGNPAPQTYIGLSLESLDARLKVLEQISLQGK